MSENKNFDIDIKKQIKTLMLLVYCLICLALFIIIPFWIKLLS